MPSADSAPENKKTGPSSGDSNGPQANNNPPATTTTTNTAAATATVTMAAAAELDDFGLPIRKFQTPSPAPTPAPTPKPAEEESSQASSTGGVTTQSDAKTTESRTVTGADAGAGAEEQQANGKAAPETQSAEDQHHNGDGSGGATGSNSDEDGDGDDDVFKDAVSSPHPEEADRADDEEEKQGTSPANDDAEKSRGVEEKVKDARPAEASDASKGQQAANEDAKKTAAVQQPDLSATKSPEVAAAATSTAAATAPETDTQTEHVDADMDRKRASLLHDGAENGVSEFSHQQLTTHQPEHNEDDDGGWQTMPAYAPYDIYDDDNKLIAKEHDEAADETYGYAGLGGAGKGYTRVVDDDAESTNSMDDNTQYLFKGTNGTSMLADEETQRDAVSQLQATKDLLTEGQRIAYVGLTRLELSAMLAGIEALPDTRRTHKEVQLAAESTKMWSQKMMVRLYSHMDISQAEQVMIEQLTDHGVMPRDLTPLLMATARVKNPMADSEFGDGDSIGKRTSVSSRSVRSVKSPRQQQFGGGGGGGFDDEEAAAEPPPPPYAPREKEKGGEEEEEDPELAAPVRTPSQMPTSRKIDIDLRWTVLCDLFLVLIADSIYDARSRVLLERVGQDLDIPPMDICRFEKKVTDALEMQQAAEKENWNEDEHMENRRKAALKRRYVMMGLATVGGGLVIGLSAGLLAPMIGAGLAAGFATIGVGGTSGFLAGAGGAAIITSTAAASGSLVGVKAANRRTGAVKTFEYRPLHNNKRVNLIVTVSGWMTGKVDDVRLPYSTVDPIMGDIYSVLWEPEMLTSMGDTINILATEALTQGLQQLLGSTILISLMAALQLPVVLTKLAYLIDNPWAVSLDRATMAGLILADSLIDRNLGTRPITLVGYSLGSRVIFSCLQELARKGAFGIVQNVFLFGSPVVVKPDEYLRARAMVAGRFVNGFNRNDWILGYLFRLTNGGIRRVAGLAAIEGVPGLENFDATDFVVGHMDYRQAMPRLLRENGWLVESDEFTEIEDPDPDNHKERQRELINEIEEARKELEREGKAAAAAAEGAAAGAAVGAGAGAGAGVAAAGATKKRFSFFRRRKEKQEWEVYEDPTSRGGGSNHRATASGSVSVADSADGGWGYSSGKTEDKEGNNHGVLFDVDAIRAELAREREEAEEADRAKGRQGNNDDDDDDDAQQLRLQVREIKSTLPPMKLDISPTPTPPPPAPARSRANTFRETKSAESLPYRASLPALPPRSPAAFEYRLPDEKIAATDVWSSSSSSNNNNGSHSYSKSNGFFSSGHTGGRGGGFGSGDGVDDEIQMTFDTSFEGGDHYHHHRLHHSQSFLRDDDDIHTARQQQRQPSPLPVPLPKDDVVVLSHNNNINNNNHIDNGATTTTTTSILGPRPEFRTSQTVPNMTLLDPWAEEEDEDFGKEKEIEMTFA